MSVDGSLVIPDNGVNVPFTEAFDSFKVSANGSPKLISELFYFGLSIFCDYFCTATTSRKSQFPVELLKHCRSDSFFKRCRLEASLAGCFYIQRKTVSGTPS